MRALPTTEEDYVRRFVDSLGLGDRDAASVYREVARHLLRFIRQHYGRMDFSREALVAWMQERRQHCASCRVEELGCHGQISERGLDIGMAHERREMSELRLGIDPAAQRDGRAAVRGRVMAGSDCGFGTFAGFGPVEPDIAYLKLKSLVEGAQIASRRLWA